ncbi:MAG: PAS domain-containing sensor histidine kinase [Pseudobdellovibrio sp.]|nr:PAS domain-containing sensor histidine kinase [Pseudobdellovibrio sp.]
MADIPPTTSSGTHDVNDVKFKLLVDSVKDYAIFFMNSNGIIQSWNTGAERIQGYKSSEIIGKHFSQFYTAPDLEKKHPEYELKTALEFGRYEEEGWRIRKDGTTFWANTVLNPLFDLNGHHLGFSKVTRDLTERKKTEERLRESERRARLMFEGVKDYAMIMLDINGCVTSWNEGARRIKGYEASEIIGKYYSIFFTEQDIQMGKCEYELKEAMETGRYEEESWLLRKDGTRFWASVLITAIREKHGKIVGFSKVTRDITDRKRAEDLLKMSYTNLEKRVEERTLALRKANEQLRIAVQTRDEFLSIASHELRTPMTPLKLQIQSLISHIHKKTLGGLTEDRLKRMADTTERSLTRLTSLVDNLLDVSRINSGKLTLNYEDCSLNELLNEILERFKSEISISGSSVQFLETQRVIGVFDQLRIDQVLVNLLTNSLKYGNKKPVEITLTQQENFAVISFKDKGKGIDAESLPLIFEKFERANAQADISGLGLGLYITRQIIDAHHGTITVSSDVGVGSVFTVKLPLVPKGQA